MNALLSFIVLYLHEHVYNIFYIYKVSCILYYKYKFCIYICLCYGELRFNKMNGDPNKERPVAAVNIITSIANGTRDRQI